MTKLKRKDKVIYVNSKNEFKILDYDRNFFEKIDLESETSKIEIYPLKNPKIDPLFPQDLDTSPVSNLKDYDRFPIFDLKLIESTSKLYASGKGNLNVLDLSEFILD